MKATGVVRRVDELGRIVVPSELRKSLHIEDRDSLEIYLDDDKIVISKYESACIFTNKPDDLYEYMGRKVSLTAISDLATKAGLL